MDPLIWKILSAALSAVPLYFALHLLGARKAGFIKVILVNVLAGVIVAGIHSYFGLSAGILSFLAVLFVYKQMFEFGWLSAFLAWLLEIVIVAAIIAGMILFLGAAML